MAWTRDASSIVGWGNALAHQVYESSTELYKINGAHVQNMESDVWLMVSLRESSWRKNVKLARKRDCAMEIGLGKRLCETLSSSLSFPWKHRLRGRRGGMERQFRW